MSAPATRPPASRSPCRRSADDPRIRARAKSREPGARGATGSWSGFERNSLHQLAALELRAELAQGLLLQLTDALARERVVGADLLEGELGLAVQADALAEDVGLHRRQLLEHLEQGVLQEGGVHQLVGGDLAGVDEGVGEAALAVAGGGQREAQRLVDQRPAHPLDALHADAGG